jgi:hypothetical protein
MQAQLKPCLVFVVLMLAIGVLPAAAQPPPPPPPALTPWCESQKAACETTCKELGPQKTASIDFKCLDEGISTTTSTRSVQCVCLDAAGNILSSSTLGGAGAAVISVGGSSSSSSSSASGRATSGR